MNRWLVLLAVGSVAGFAFYARPRLGQQRDGSFLVSTGQTIQLLGKSARLEMARPKDMALSPDGKVVALLAHARLLVLDLDGNSRGEIPIAAAPLGVAWSPDGGHIYASLGTGKIGVFFWSGKAVTKEREVAVEPQGKRGNPGLAGLSVGADGAIYAALSIRNQVVALSPDGTIRTTWPVGACPYHPCLSHDGRLLAVANRGGTIIAPNPEQGDPSTRTAFEGTGVASARSAGTAVQIDPRTDAALAGTISFLHVDDPSALPKTVAVGRQPSGMRFSADGQTLFVADADEDALSQVDVMSLTERARIPLAPARDPAFGQIPTDVALSPDERRIYVSLGGANAVAVLEWSGAPNAAAHNQRDTSAASSAGTLASSLGRASAGVRSLKIQGYFPTAWYPLAVAALPDRVLIACAKGIGSRPGSKSTGFGVHDSVGVFQSMSLSDIRDLRGGTRLVAKNNGWTDTPGPRKDRTPVPVPERVGEPSVFKHVVYIIKENLSYDTAMGDMTSGNGDPSLCVFPEEVSPNHHALARRFGLLDNFYISGTNSADGHQWVDSSVANDYTERNYGANQRSYPFDGGDPLAFSPAGFLWSQAKAAGKSVRVFGEFVDQPLLLDRRGGRVPDWQRCWADYKSGKGEIFIRATTSEAGLRASLDPTYIGFPMNVSDQWRADVFLGELRAWDQGTGDMPNLTIMLLPNDHTGGTRPGWPTPRAYVADNDYALGRIVEGITRSKFWPQTLIIVAEDDSQNGLDHVDGHRSICFCISPYSHQGETIDDMYTHVSIAATIGHVLGLPPMTRFDRTARPMLGCFTDHPDTSPYVVVPNRVPIDELNPPAKAAGSAQARRLAEACAKMDWSEPDIQDEDILNRAIWQREAPRSVAKSGYAITYPSH